MRQIARASLTSLLSSTAPRQIVRLPRWLALALLAVGLGAAVYALANILPVGADYYWWYYRVPQKWLAGQTQLYDEASRQFFSPPWALLLFLPFAALEANWAMASYTLLSLAIVVIVSYKYAQENGSPRPRIVALLAVFCPYTLVMLFTGTPDAWSLLGLFLGFRAIQTRQPLLLGIGLVLALIRPQNAALTVPVFLVALRHWPPKELARGAAIPTLILVASFLSFGWDWPLRYWDSYFIQPPSPRWFTSIYTGLELLGIPGWTLAPPALALMGAVFQQSGREGLSRRVLEKAVAINALIIPYTRSVSFVVLLALPWAGLAARQPRMAAAVYTISLPTLAVALFWERLAVVDLTFPLVLLGLLVLETRLPAKSNGHVP